MRLSLLGTCRWVVWMVMAGLACAAQARPVLDRSTPVATLQAAAERGDRDAQLMLGERLQAGLDVPRDDAAGAGWIREAAEHGLGRAQYALGMIMISGRGVPRDPSGTIAWLRKAADQGVVDAQYELGMALIDFGRADRPGFDLGLPWIRKAAENGSRLAQVQLADMLARGFGVVPDLAAATEWYRRAAEHGSVRAHWQLARSRADRHGAPRDDDEARFHLLAAGPDADPAALREIERRLPQDRIAAAARRARD
jgi:uncharacterized protein